jgi:hypothetical protein
MTIPPATSRIGQRRELALHSVRDPLALALALALALECLLRYACQTLHWNTRILLPCHCQRYMYIRHTVHWDTHVFAAWPVARGQRNGTNMAAWPLARGVSYQA